MLRETDLDLDLLAQTESVFALSNGHIGWRGNLDEGEPHGLPGTYLNGVYELRPLPYAEAGYGYPESGQTVINVTNGKLIRLLVDDEPFDVRYGELRAHERVLDFRAGRAAPHAPSGCRRPASGPRHLDPAGVVHPAGGRGDRLRGRAARRPGPDRRCSPSWWRTSSCPSASADPRVAAVLDAPLASASTERRRDARSCSCTRPGGAGCGVAAAMDHLIDGPPGVQIESRAYPDGGLVTVTAALEPGQKLRLVKFVAYGWSGERSLPALRDQAWAALARPGRPAGTGCSPSSARTSTTSGTAPTSRWTGTPRSSRRCASRCSTSCRPAPGPRAGPSRPRA